MKFIDYIKEVTKQAYDHNMIAFDKYSDQNIYTEFLDNALKETYAHECLGYPKFLVIPQHVSLETIRSGFLNTKLTEFKPSLPVIRLGYDEYREWVDFLKTLEMSKPEDKETLILLVGSTSAIFGAV